MASSRLSPEFYARPFTHRGLHDRKNGIIENSRKAVQAAIDHGYAIEIDLQLSKDGQAMVFHDYGLQHLCGREGVVQHLTSEELNAIPLLDGGETIPTLAEILDITAGQVPLLIEFKDQDGKMGPDIGHLEKAALELLEGYKGDFAVMSFNPYSPLWFAQNAPDIPRGLVSYAYDHADDAHIPQKHRDDMANLRHDTEIQCDFISYGSDDLADEAPVKFRNSGRPVFCWTIKSLSQEQEARKYCDQITFEQYLAE